MLKYLKKFSLHLSILKAIGMLQALAEFHFFRPSQLNELKSVEHERKFEKFWESKVPRIGEEFPDGWANFCNEDEVSTEEENEVATEEWIQAEGKSFSNTVVNSIYQISYVRWGMGGRRVPDKVVVRAVKRQSKYE
jgi:hypothetical protein